ncbi:LuxR C-terminal-related transcriptional regulator [Dactylosporangium sp. NPDC049525]|uniref:ATP-binding protein n=1 Tax=Dactylosporangium sp. NPDC049525 TaxID=3154730 RepID=UPI00344A3C7C
MTAVVATHRDPPLSPPFWAGTIRCVDHDRALSRTGLSARETEVLAALGEHLTNAEVGVRLFISTRTVETHVASLLRKLGVDNRRALARMAAGILGTQEESSVAQAAGELDTAPAVGGRTTLPTPLTPFIGRAGERASLTAALQQHRLVTALGPGGIGKTRLALAVAGDIGARFADGTWYVDLVPVTDPSMVATAVMAALGLGEQPGRDAEAAVIDWLAHRHALLVMDNCEHLVDGVAELLERLLTETTRVVVLATSRTHLLLPFEQVFPVAGMSMPGDGEAGDAVTLFCARAAAAGSTLSPVEDRSRIAAVCRGLDGLALAIELAAARLPALGLDGLESALADPLRLLTGRRLNERHRSLRSTLDWSYALLDQADQALLRRVCVFAGPFPVAAAMVVAGQWPPVEATRTAEGLARLAEHSLLIAVIGAAGTRYRALETVRQYGADRLHQADEADDAAARHLRWCLDVASTLEATTSEHSGVEAAFDDVADELRAALGRAAGHPERHSDAYRLASMLANLTFACGMPGESQRRYEQAAGYAGSDHEAAAALHRAAAAAQSRHSGADALRLHRAAAEMAIRAGDNVGAARDLAMAAELINRGSGLFSHRTTQADVTALIDRARALAGRDSIAEARILSAEAYRAADTDPATTELVQRALTLAQRSADPATESAALDRLTELQIARGEVRAAEVSALRRVELLTPLPVQVDVVGLELADALGAAAETAVAAGNLNGARRFARHVLDLPFLREDGHLATGRLLVVDALTGDWAEAVSLSGQFREGWERAGRPNNTNHSRGAYAAAAVFGMRGHDDAMAEWLEVARRLTADHRRGAGDCFSDVVGALLLLHQGHPEQAFARLGAPPEQFHNWHNGLWRTWYVALRAESAVLAGAPDAEVHLVDAGPETVDNPVAAAILARAAAMATGDRDALTAVATAFKRAGCQYQWARTLVFAGGRERARGEAALAAIGATPMP